ncbi:MAG: hypothetical protein R2751_13380 [Bacteroidales bacterium]
MKRFFIPGLLLVPFFLSGQVVNFAKTLPERAFSVGLTPAYHFDNNVILFDAGGPAAALNVGYGVQYSFDVGAKYYYFLNGPDYIGIDGQILVHESRESYVSIIAGGHKWEHFGADLTGLYTYAPRYAYNFSVGLDLDLDFADELLRRVWIPLNVGLNANEMLYVYAEYNLPVSEMSWSIVALGINVILR